MTAAQTLEAMAFGLRASLIQDKGEIRLRRTPDDDRRNLEGLRAYWRSLFDNEVHNLDRHSQESASLGDAYDRYNHYSAIQEDQQRKRGDRTLPNFRPTLNVFPAEFKPSGALYAGVLRAIGTGKLAATLPETVTLWSNQPHGRQRLVTGGDALLKQYARDQSAFLARAKRSETYQEPARFLLRQYSGTQLSLKIYNSSGNLIDQYNPPPLTLPMQGPFLISPYNLISKYAASPTSWRPVPAESLALRPFAANPPQRGQMPPQRLPELVKFPEKVDPLRPFAQIGLESLAAEEPGDGCVILPTDDLVELAAGCLVGDRWNFGVFRELMTRKEQTERAMYHGVVIYRPQDYTVYRRNTVDRFKLGEQCRQLLSLGTIDTPAMMKATFALFPQCQSLVGRRLMETIFRTQPHSRAALREMDLDSRALLGALLTTSPSESGPVRISTASGPISTLVSWGIHEQRLSFDSETPLSDEDREEASILDGMSEMASQVSIQTEPRIGIWWGLDTQDDFPFDLPLTPVPAAYGALGSTFLPSPLLHLPAEDQKEVAPAVVAATLPKLGYFNLGLRRQMAFDIAVGSHFRWRRTIEEDESRAVNLRFSELPPDTQQDLIRGTSNWIRLNAGGKQPIPLSTDPPTTH